MSAPTLDQLRDQIAAQITSFPPDMQAQMLRVVAFAYSAGYRSCQQDMQTAAQSLTLAAKN